MPVSNKVWNKPLLQKFLFLILLGLGWEAVARAGIFSPAVFPSMLSIFRSFATGITDGILISRTVFSLALILKGLLLSMLLALILSALAMISSLMENLVDVLNSVLHPLPGLALLPVAILWFGIGEISILLIIIHSVLWPMVINFLTGFRAIPTVHMELGRTFGLKRWHLLLGIMLPSSLPYILSGIKIGWARAWRSAIAVEMVFGAAAGTIGGLGWHIYMTRYMFDISGTFAALLAIIMVGILVEEMIFRMIENATVRRWGMVNQGG